MKALRPVILLLAVAATGPANAQQYGTLDVNDVRFDVLPMGHIGRSYDFGAPTFTVPADSGTNSLYSAGIWITGRTSDGQLKTAVDLFGYGDDFFPGPLTVAGDASITPEVSSSFDHVWNIRAADVERHRAYHTCATDPDCDLSVAFPDGYVTPQEFITWPAMGDTDEGQAQYLAPFFDHNLDGVYSAIDGDHPCVPGDQALFSIFNDKLAPHTESYGVPLGVEVHMTSFAYGGNDPALEQTVFVHYKIINRSDQTLSDLRVGLFMDPDLGCPNDDFMGTDVARSTFYVYNWDDFDDDNCTGVPGYGTQPPAFGMTVLKGPLMDPDGSDNTDIPPIPAFNGTRFNDGVIDNERYGLTNSILWNRNGTFAVSDPHTSEHFENYLHSVWKDGTHLTSGNWGYNADPSSTPTEFVFPGDSDPLGIASGGIPQDPWMESIQALQDRYGVAATGGGTLIAGGEQEILIAYVYARALEGGALASVAALQQRVDSIAAFASDIPGIINHGTPCDGIRTTGIADRSSPSHSLALFPVPATRTLTVGTTEFVTGSTMEVLNSQGSVMVQSRTTSSSTTLDLEGLNPGLYTVRITGKRKTATGRFVKQ